MRPLVVLLLVLVAGLVLFLTLNRSSSPPTVPTINPNGPGLHEPTPPKPADTGPVEAPGGPVRTPTPSVQVGPGVNETAMTEALPGDNSLYGLVMNEQKQPVAGAKVELSRDARMGQEMALTVIIGNNSGIPPIVTTTDANGSYRFKNVIPRRDYFLVVSHKSYAPVQEQLVAVGEKGEFQGPNVIMKAGSVVEGQVTDVAKNVVPNAELFLDSAFYSGMGESTDRLTTKSDAMGHFEFTNVYAVPKQLTCKAEGYGSQTKTPVNVQGSPGERVAVDFMLEVGQAIGGSVVGADNVGIEGALILAYNTGTGQSYRGDAVSLQDGSFQLLNLHPGTYTLTCEKKGFRQAKSTRVACGNMAVVIDMIAQACVSGRVVDSANAPVTSFTVSVRRLPPNQAPGIGVAGEDIGLKETFDNATDGSFQLCGLDPGTYSLLVGSASAAPTFSEMFAITPDRASTNVSVRLTKGGSIKGRIVSPSGAPVAGAVVRTCDDTFDDDPTDPLFGSMIATNTTSRQVTTSADGAFELRFLTPEKYQLRITHPSYAQGKLRGVMVSEGQPTDIATITMQVGGTVKGTVIGQGGTPLRGGFVHLESDTSDIVLDTRSDDEGRFTFTHVRPGPYTLSAMVNSSTSDNAFDNIGQMLRTQTPITVSEGGELTRELTLAGG